MNYSNQPGPYVPVVLPRGFRREVDVTPLYGASHFGETEEEELARKRTELLDELELERLRREELLRKRDIAFAPRDSGSGKSFLLFGLAGVAIGAIVTGGMTAAALRSYRRTDSVLGPAIYAGLGSAAMGGAMVLILSRVVGGKDVDPRVAALAVGARMAS